MSEFDLARTQFAMTSIYHFLFVPVTIGLSFLIALLQTSWHRTGKPEYLRLTKFFGTLLVINIAVGVVTGLVQEFQFGMNWSAYARTVGDVFGAPLAMEGLAAFFLESTFLGLWIFGWNVLSPRIHLLTIWAVALGGVGSAAFIMAANSWMQNPVGYEINPDTGLPQLNDIAALLTNPVFLRGYLHVVLASLITGATVMLAVAAWQLRKGKEPEVFQPAARLALVLLVPTLMVNMLVGSELGVTEATYQPMKIAASEAQWETCQPCSFSVFQIGGGKNDHDPVKVIEIPHLLSLLATNSWNGKVLGLDELQSTYEQEYGPGEYVPNVFIQYWAMRVMAYTASLLLLISLWGLWRLWRKKLPTSRKFLHLAVWAAILPFVINTAGWVLTENGRQPWIVQGLLLTEDGVSPSVSTAEVVTSVLVFFLLYAALTVTAWVLMTRYARKDLPPGPTSEPDQPVDVPAMTF